MQRKAEGYRQNGGVAAVLPRSKLMRIRDIDVMLPKAANLSIAIYVALLLAVYGMTPRDEWEYLSLDERSAAFLGLVALTVCCLLILLPAAVQRRVVKENDSARTRISGIVYAAMVVQLCAMSNNFILAFCPNVVKFDQFSQSRVFIVRWCEFIPLAGLMTFLCEAIDLPKDGMKKAVLSSLSEAIACFAGILLPLSGDLQTWRIVIALSFTFYLPIFWRLYVKYNNFKSTPVGRSMFQKENYDRIRLSYKLLFQCSWVWTSFVALYFTNLAIHQYCPPGHPLRVKGLAMVFDTLLDVIAKAVYMIVIVEVHYKLEHHY